MINPLQIYYPIEKKHAQKSISHYLSVPLTSQSNKLPLSLFYNINHCVQRKNSLRH